MMPRVHMSRMRDDALVLRLLRCSWCCRTEPTRHDATRPLIAPARDARSCFNSRGSRTVRRTEPARHAECVHVASVNDDRGSWYTAIAKIDFSREFMPTLVRQGLSFAARARRVENARERAAPSRGARRIGLRLRLQAACDASITRTSASMRDPHVHAARPLPAFVLSRMSRMFHPLCVS